MDAFKTYQTSLESPAIRAQAVTPNDTTDLPFVSRALNVSGSGAVRVTTVAGDTAVISVAAGSTFPIRVSRVWATDTTATGIVALA